MNARNDHEHLEHRYSYEFYRLATNVNLLALLYDGRSVPLPINIPLVDTRENKY